MLSEVWNQGVAKILYPNPRLLKNSVGLLKQKKIESLLSKNLTFIPLENPFAYGAFPLDEDCFTGKVWTRENVNMRFTF